MDFVSNFHVYWCKELIGVKKLINNFFLSIHATYCTGCCKSPIRFEKRVYVAKPALNLLKTRFSREKPAKMSAKPGFC
jgi:hypothetical protein